MKSREKLNKKSWNKKLALGGIAALVLIGGIYFAQKQVAKKAPADQISVSDEAEDQEGIRIPKPTNEEPSPDGNASEPEPADQQSSSISVTITQAESSGDNVIVRALVDGLKSGTCEVTFSKAGQKAVVKTAPIGIVTSYYACQGFSLHRSNFVSKGTWQVRVKASGGGKYNLSETHTVQVY